MTDLAALSLQRRIDRLVAPWDASGSPGVTVAVISDGAIALRRHAGLASIELDHAIGDDTTFRIASVTKQFTCLAVLMLAEEGKLAVGDDIRRHLPELPDLGQRITLDHLMHNTSGIRDMFELMRLGGLDLHQPCRPEDLLAAIRRQRGLNFAPGERFLYSNSNFLLLGLVVERHSGLSLAEFLARRIFRPLGMNRTHLVSTTDTVVSGLATGYLARQGVPGGFVRAQHAYPLGGEGGLVSSAEDLALWERNFATGLVGGLDRMAALEMQVPFANGTVNAYARGVEIHAWRGLRTVSHGGLWPGFKTLFLRVPEKRLAVICIANLDAVDVHALGHDILDTVLLGESGIEPAPKMPPPALLKVAQGRYLDRAGATTLEIGFTATGQPTASMYGASFGLVPTEDGRLAAHRGAFPLTLALAPDGGSIAAELDAGATSLFHRVEAEIPPPADLAGRYVNDEVAAQWTIAPAGNAAELSVEGPLAKAGPWRVVGIDGDIVHIYAAANWIRSAFDARVLRDQRGTVTGLSVSGGRVKGMVMRRVEG
jgi:D-aminopeptidase